MKLSTINLVLFLLFTTTLFAQDLMPIQPVAINECNSFYATDNLNVTSEYRLIGLTCSGKISDTTLWELKKLYTDTIYIETDIKEEDEAGRKLVYVCLNDGSFLNYLILKKGLADYDSATPNLKYSSSLQKAHSYSNYEK